MSSSPPLPVPPLPVPADQDPLSDLAGHLGRALDLSERMLAAARDGDWPRLTGLEAERGAVLDAVLPGLAPGLDARRREQVVPVLAACLRVNEELAAITGEQVRALRQSLDAMDAARVRDGRDPAFRATG
ncbi:MAG: hypothetical protein FGM40_08870 [Rhodocyclaceae bacterium]|nr:hypothetical protein [Rhodocyclaceae bacterium]